MRFTSPLGRKVAAVLVVGLAAATLGVTAGAAQAAPSLGTLTISPATGSESSLLQADLSASCPGDATGIVGYVTGPGISDPNNAVIQSNRAPATSFQVSGIFKDVFAANSIAAPSGTYTVRMACIGPDFFTEDGQFSQDVVFTPTSGTNNGSFVTVLPATTTTLQAPSPTDPVASGTSVTLQASVDGGTAGTPTGSVQFKSGATNIGAPVALTAGSASLITTALPAGTDSLTATYVPSGANPLAASTSSAASYVVAGPTSIAGVVRVGRTINCSAVTGGTRTYAWTRNGALTSVTAGSVLVPASWYNTTITCSLTSTKAGNSVTRASAGVKVAIGAAPVATARPKVLGIMHVARLLTCSHGTWSPAPSGYRYQWLRSGRAIAGKTARTYRAVAADRGRLISCRVTAVLAGHTNGVSTAPARKVT